MPVKLGVTSKQLFESINQLMRAGTDLRLEQPVVLTSGGIYLRWRRISRQLASWHPKLFLPHARQTKIRVFQLKGETVQRSLERVMEMGSLN